MLHSFVQVEYHSIVPFFTVGNIYNDNNNKAKEI